ncbi:MAG: YopX family protein [Coprococcus comes]|nr:YopX family protein [Coprococcus comes]
MNREILFRGKHIHAMDSNEHLNGTWVHGYLSDKNYIYDKSLEGNFLVDENTICQYTGLHDKNGKKIFDGDVVKDSAGVCGEVKFGLYEAGFSITDTNQGFFIEFPKESLYRKELGYWENKVVVIGNIYDKPEQQKDQISTIIYKDFMKKGTM